MDQSQRTISEITIVTPTFRRPAEVAELLDNLRHQSLLPAEIILVDGAPPEETATEEVVKTVTSTLPFPCRYIRRGGGTAVQRNTGIENAKTPYIALIDDDIRPEPDFLEQITRAFADDRERKVGGIVGYRTNQHFDTNVQRWRWYRRLRFFSTYEPGRYDFTSGYPINVNLQPPFSGIREVDFMTTSCAVWRRDVFDSGLSFDPFFRDYGMLEDAHFSLRAGRQWKLWQCGDACCLHLHSPHGRPPSRKIGYKCVVNYYYVFQDVVRPLTWRHRLRFWRFQAFELLRVFSSAIRRRRWSDVMEFWGRIEGIFAIARGEYEFNTKGQRVKGSKKK
ncbi:MAG: glycosyltransferase [Acidobacteria bacterium]|nr:glycosyltransferase [Acidobacteriota bacterium]